MWFNPLMTWLLRSPFHRLISGSVMLLRYTGRKSGKPYATPVNYLRDGDALTTVSSRDRTWWRNLRGGAPVTLLLQGKQTPARGEVIETDEGVAAALLLLLQRNPQYARFMNVSRDEAGGFNAGDLARAAAQRVVVHFQLAA